LLFPKIDVVAVTRLAQVVAAAASKEAHTRATGADREKMRTTRPPRRMQD
jgi:hypothetical protein